MSNDNQALRELANAATPGPWRTLGDHVAQEDSMGAIVCNVYVPITSDAQIDANAAYIAGAHPQAILALLDRVDELEKALEHLERKAAEVSRVGAVPGRHFADLTQASLRARTTLRSGDTNG